MDKEVHEAFYGKYNGIFYACVSSVYQTSPRGEGPGTHCLTMYTLDYVCKEYMNHSPGLDEYTPMYMV